MGNKYPKYLTYLIYLIWAFFLFTIIYDLFVIPSRSIFWVFELALALIIYYKVRIPAGVYFGILAFFLANLFGELFLGLFYYIPFYDKILHLSSPLVSGAFLYSVFKKKIPDKRVLIFFSVTFILSLSLLWELIEYFSDQAFHTLLQGVVQANLQTYDVIQVFMPRFEDTIYDMLDNLIGATVFAAGAFFFTRKKKR